MSKTSVSLLFLALALNVSTAFAWPQWPQASEMSQSQQRQVFGRQLRDWGPFPQTIVITDTTRYINVTRWDVVRLVHGNSEILWRFDGFWPYFNLQEVLGPEIAPNPITVFITPRIE